MLPTRSTSPGAAVMTAPETLARVDALHGPIPAAAPGRCPSPRVSARSLARLHDRYRSAVWRGDDVGEITAWLAAHWQEPAPGEPWREPDAVSCMGRYGIRWYRHGSVILGYPPRAAGCYRVSRWESPPITPSLLHGGYTSDRTT